MSAKRTRLLTNRSYPDGKSYEAIERDGNGQLYWVGVDHAALPTKVTFCFPVDEAFAKHVFQLCGREWKSE